jgi:hypothetical protein
MKDYWKMTDDELKRLAEKYQLPSVKEKPYVGEVFDRERVINGLVFRVASRRAAWAFIISVLALIVSATSIALRFLPIVKN